MFPLGVFTPVPVVGGLHGAGSKCVAPAPKAVCTAIKAITSSKATAVASAAIVFADIAGKKFVGIDIKNRTMKNDIYHL